MLRPLACALASLLLWTVPSLAAVRWQVLDSTEELLRVRVEILGASLEELPAAQGQDQKWSLVRLEGARDSGTPGQPLLPRAGRWIVLPPEGDVEVESRVIGTVSLGRARLVPHPTPRLEHDALPGEPPLREDLIEAEDYARFRVGIGDVVRLADPVFQRRQRMAALELQPVLYDAATGVVEAVQAVEILVRFPRAKTLGEEGGPADGAVIASALNGELAARWRCLPTGLRERRAVWREAPTPRQAKAAAVGVQAFDRSALLGSEIRLRAEDTGLLRVRVSDLLGAGGLPADQPRRNLRLYQKRPNDPLAADYPTPLATDVPFAFLDPVDPDQPLSTSDVIIFHAFSAQDDWVERTVDADAWPLAMPRRPDNYNSANVYFMAMMDPGAGSWARVESTSLDPSQGANLQSQFQQEVTLTDDLGFQDNPPSLDPDVQRFHWNDRFDTDVARSVPLFHPAPGGLVDVTWTSARRSLDTAISVDYLLEKDGQTWPLQTIVYPSGTSSSIYDRLYPTTVSLPTDPIGDGFVRFLMRRLNNGIPASVNAFLGSVTLSYPALYRATFDELEFHTEVEGAPVDLEVTGFSDPSVQLWEVTDPRRPRRVALQPANRLDNGDGSYRLSLNVPQTAGQQRRFVAVAAGRIPRMPSSRIESDPVVDVFDTVDGHQILAVGPEPLRAAMQPWLDWRRQHNPYGWDVAYVDLQQIYDQFSGGLQSAHAIKALAEYAYVQWDARALVLVGDGNEETRGVTADAGPNLVPPSLHLQTFSTNRELLASDKWYAVFGAPLNYPRGLSRTSDMVVGRLAVADAAQLGSLIQKIQAYEQPRGDDEWRSRTLWMADDAYSTDYIGSGSGDCYSLHPLELNFASSQTRNAGVVDTALDGTMSGTVWDLDTFTSPCRQGVPCENESGVTQCAQAPARDRLFQLLDQGWLIVSYQGHANYRALGHEGFLQRGGLSSLGNNGRPFLFFGMGCHVSDFLQYDEGRIGQSIGEAMLLLGGRGAVATYGSSGFEFLTPNKVFMEEITDTFFTQGRANGPVLSDQPLRGQWMLGEVLAQAELDLLATPNVGSKDEMVAQYNLLGDPLLRMDAAPPRLAASLGGARLPAGASIEADPGARTAAIAFDLVDETGIDRLEITDSEGRDYGSQLVLAPSSDPRLRSGSISLPVYPQTYTVVLDLYDGAYFDTRPSTLELSVVVESRVTIDGIVLEEGQPPVIVPIGRTVPVRVELTTPVGLVESEISVTMEGGSVSNLRVGGSGRQWTLDFDAVASSDEVQAILLELAPDVIERLELIGEEPAPLALGVHYPVPNPTRGGEPVNIVVQANDSVESARLTVYDLSGRTVFARDLPAVSGGSARFVVQWDARDQRGDEVANGTYLYRVEARRGSAVSRTDMGRIVVMR